jgi:hypothetical protein
MLYVDPVLPEWMPSLTVRDLKLGAASFDIRFYRNAKSTEFEVLKGPAAAVERRSMTEWTRLLRHRKENNNARTI